MGFAFHFYHIESNCPVKLTVEYIVQDLFLNQKKILQILIWYLSLFMKAAGGIKIANLAKKIVTQLAISCNNHVTVP